MTANRHMRLIRLEQLAEPRACHVCRFWGPCVCLWPGEAPRPETCPNCGRYEPIRLERVYVIVPPDETAGVA